MIVARNSGYYFDLKHMTKETSIGLELQRKIGELYTEGLSPSKIVKLYPNENLTLSAIHYYLNKHGVQTRSLSESHIIYSRCDDYFNAINSHEKAQVLGFIAADGCITESQTGQRALTVTLHKTDTDYLEHIKNSLKYSGPIRMSRGVYPSLSITSSLYFNDLVRLGVTQRKSLTLVFPTSDQVPEEFVGSYVCGYFEGDGSIVIRRNRKLSVDGHLSICVTKEFGNTLSRILNVQLDVTSLLRQKKDHQTRNINSYSLLISGNKQVTKVMEWMYKKVPYKMSRKYDKLKEITSLYDANGDFIKTEEWRRLKRDKFLAGMKRNGRDPSQNEKKKAFYVSPKGVVFHILGIAAFGREMGLQCAGLSRLNGGGQTTYKGWSLATPDQVTTARASGILIERFY